MAIFCFLIISCIYDISLLHIYL